MVYLPLKLKCLSHKTISTKTDTLLKRIFLWLVPFGLKCSYETIHESKLPYRFIDPDVLSPSPLLSEHSAHLWAHNRLHECGVLSLNPIRQLHSFPSFGIVARLSNQCIIAYSGDSRPNGVFSQAALSSQLLIHEATFFIDQKDKAVSDNHSTLPEALSVISAAQPCSALLTHFSSRLENKAFDLVSFFPPDLPTPPPPVLQAFDFLHIPIQADMTDFRLFIPKLQPYLLKLYPFQVNGSD
jgi:hypothetical protein